MKSRADDNDASGSQSKPPLDSPGNESNGEAIDPLKALSYVNEVKDMFHDQQHKYRMFLEVFNDYSAKRIDMATVIARVKELFKGYKNLMIGFNTFLSPENKIALDDVEDTASSTTGDY